MTRSRKVFIAFVALFVLLLAYFSFDIASRTSFPGQHKKSDSINVDSAHEEETSKSKN